MESLEHAQKRGATILAEYLGGERRVMLMRGLMLEHMFDVCVLRAAPDAAPPSWLSYPGGACLCVLLPTLARCAHGHRSLSAREPTPRAPAPTPPGSHPRAALPPGRRRGDVRRAPHDGPAPRRPGRVHLHRAGAQGCGHRAGRGARRRLAGWPCVACGWVGKQGGRLRGRARLAGRSPARLPRGCPACVRPLRCAHPTHAIHPRRSTTSTRTPPPRWWATRPR